MRDFLVWAIGYIGAGAYYVHQDLVQPIHNRPAYVRNFLSCALVGALWLPAILIGVWSIAVRRGRVLPTLIGRALPCAIILVASAIFTFWARWFWHS